MELLILGASGRVGGEAVKAAIARGHRVVAQVRSSARYAPPSGAGTLVVDPLDMAADVDLRRFDAIVSCIGQRHIDPRNPLSPMAPPADLCARVAQWIVARAASGQRVVAVSAAGVGDSMARVHPTWRLALPRSVLAPAYADLEVMEATLQAAALDVLCVRPTLLVDWGRRPARPIARAGALARVSRSAVAKFLIEAAEGRGGAGAVMISG